MPPQDRGKALPRCTKGVTLTGTLGVLVKANSWTHPRGGGFERFLKGTIEVFGVLCEKPLNIRPRALLFSQRRDAAERTDYLRNGLSRDVKVLMEPPAHEVGQCSVGHFPQVLDWFRDKDTPVFAGFLERWLDRQPYDEARYLMALQKRHAPLLAFAAKAST